VLVDSGGQTAPVFEGVEGAFDDVVSLDADHPVDLAHRIGIRVCNGR